MVHLPLKLFLAVTIVVMSVTAEEQLRECAQCVSGNFLARQWLMQHSEAGQSMGWVDQWTGTNCATGKMIIIKCHHACLTVTLQRKLDNGQFVDDGMMMDCAEELIHASPDLPNSGEGFRYYNDDATHSNVRHGFNITYKFSTESFKTKQVVVKDTLATFRRPEAADDYQIISMPSLLLFGFVTSIAFFVAIALCHKERVQDYYYDTTPSTRATTPHIPLKSVKHNSLKSLHDLLDPSKPLPGSKSDLPSGKPFDV